MSATLAQIWRHPVKGIGTEALDRVSLTENRPLPFDRAWAVLEEGRESAPGWQPCRNFLRGAKGPSLMAVQARVDDDIVHLSHPERPDFSLHLVEGAAPALFDWLAPIYPATRRPPVRLVRAPEQGMTDAPFASVSVLNVSSLRALAQKVGRDLDPRRFRGNLWLDGLAPWEEFDLVGKHLRIGEALLELVEPITRCRATEANPDTGQRDVPTLQVLEAGWGHTDFGIYARVLEDGAIATGDPVRVE